MNKHIAELQRAGDTFSTNYSFKDFCSRLKGVLLAPVKTMQGISKETGILYQVILIVAVIIGSLLLNTAQFKESTKAEIIKTNIEQKITMTDEKLAEKVNMNFNASLAFIPAISIIMWVWGTVILFALMKVMGGKGSFRDYLAITCYAYLVILISGVIQSIFVFITGKYEHDFSISSLGFYLPGSFKGNFFYGFLGSFDLFKLWNYALIGIGVYYLSKLSKLKVYIAVLLLFLTPLFLNGFTELMSTMVKK